MISVPALAVAVTLIYYLANSHRVATDNAYIKQDKISVSAEVGGTIVEVRVAENQAVAAGDLLFRIDPEPYQLAVDQAEAAVASATARVEEMRAALVSSRVAEAKAREDITYFDREFRRQQALLKTSVTSEADLQAAEHQLARAKSELDAAQAELGEDQAALATAQSAVADARVQLARARLNLARTRVRAPAAGVVSQTSRLHVGQLMVQSLPAVTIVRNDASWIEANFKETDLARMRTGQPAVIEVDSYPDLALQGRVESIGAGTGSEFSILPAQNATGNWVKVTQRVPVRIALVDSPSRPLIAGLSVHVSVDTSR